VRIAITGVTGVLGRNLLFEAIRQHATGLNGLELVLLGRGDRGTAFRQRVEGLLAGDGMQYLSSSPVPAHDALQHARQNTTCINWDLMRDDLGLAPDDVWHLRNAPIDLFLHCAALTDLRPSAHAELQLRRTNVDGTRRLLTLLEELRVREFAYVGSAYCCGDTTGRIRPDHTAPHNGFRNPYEATKLEAELAVRTWAKRTGVRCRYFRPSIICGRLIEHPLGSIAKFGVFYGLAGFLYRLRAAVLGRKAASSEEVVDLGLRACCNPQGGLNIVPADYAAKVILQVCAQDDPAESYHVVNDSETPHSVLIPVIMETLGIRGVTIVDRMPADRNRNEELYYRTVGRLFSPYILAAPMDFDTSTVRKVVRRASLRCPELGRDNIRVLLEYAKDRGFGLRDGRATRLSRP
jgi:nucleoside-diphosphate-sugar epimerase